MSAPELLIDEHFLPDSEPLFQWLLTNVAWDERMAARRTASYGKAYNYSQLTYPESPLLHALSIVADQLAARLGIRFNNCLLNYYESGNNAMGFHADDTSGLVAGTGVAIVSLGCSRHITYRQKMSPENQISYCLAPGSLLYMDDAVQLEWQHAIKREKSAGPRISLTWRAIAA